MVGQKAAVRLVVSAVARARAGLQEANRPIAALLLYGPPGAAGFWEGARSAWVWSLAHVGSLGLGLATRCVGIGFGVLVCLGLSGVFVGALRVWSSGSLGPGRFSGKQDQSNAASIPNAMQRRPAAEVQAVNIHAPFIFDMGSLEGMWELFHEQTGRPGSLPRAVLQHRLGFRSRLAVPEAGVGKTSLASALAETWLGSRRALIRVEPCLHRWL